MTDTRLPEQWLNHPAIEAMNDATYRVYINGLMYSVKNGLDGRIDARALRLLHPDGALPDAAEQLVAIGRWSVHAEGGWVIVGFADYQSTAEQVADQREKNRIRQENWRREQAAKAKAAKAKVTGGDETADVTRDVTRDVTQHVGKAKDQATTDVTTSGQVGEPHPSGEACHRCHLPMIVGKGGRPQHPPVKCCKVLSDAAEVEA